MDFISTSNINNYIKSQKSLYSDTQPADETEKTQELPAAADDEQGNAQNIPS